ncbi:MAG: PQQ-binding-like beta-propeller repeat protein, partial [Acidobacteria bacterium]|nr:PQQ-binding-like beta-propeller repeat protein [Acidobacteriota bacterium]
CHPVRRGRTGALDGSDVAWTAGSGSNFASPFVYRDCVYWVNPAGAARCLAPESGAVRWTHRLPDSIWATPLGHDDHVYFFTTEGVTQVLRASDEVPEVVATNRLSVDAPVTGFAAVDDAIVIRAGTEVIRVGRPAE